MELFKLTASDVIRANTDKADFVRHMLYHLTDSNVSKIALMNSKSVCSEFINKYQLLNPTEASVSDFKRANEFAIQILTETSVEVSTCNTGNNINIKVTEDVVVLKPTPSQIVLEANLRNTSELSLSKLRGAVVWQLNILTEQL